MNFITLVKSPVLLKLSDQFLSTLLQQWHGTDEKYMYNECILLQMMVATTT